MNHEPPDFAKASIIVLCVSVSLWPVSAIAQVSYEAPPFDSIHLSVPEIASARDWYLNNIGGNAGETADRIAFGRWSGDHPLPLSLIFDISPGATPTAGSVIESIGFSYADLDAKMKEFEAAGVKVATPARDVAGLFKLAFIEDPWGTRIEVVQDPETLGLHHVHLRAPDTATALAWYLEKFGGESAKLKGRLDAVKYGNVWVLAQRGDATPSEGHAIDHIGWRTANLEAKIAELKAQNVKVTTEPRALKLASGTIVNFAYLEGPAGTKIELVQR